MLFFFPSRRLRAAEKQLPKPDSVSAQLRDNLNKFMNFRRDALDEIQRDLDRLEDQRSTLTEERRETETALSFNLNELKDKIRERTKIEERLLRTDDQLDKRTQKIDAHFILEKEINSLNLQIKNLEDKANKLPNQIERVEFEIKRLLNGRNVLSEKNKETIATIHDISGRLRELEDENMRIAALYAPSSTYKAKYNSAISSVWGFFTSFIPVKSSRTYEARKQFAEHVDDRVKNQSMLLSLTKKYHETLPKLNKIIESYSILLRKKPIEVNAQSEATNPSTEPRKARR